jgi:hypothetical protein
MLRRFVGLSRTHVGQRWKLLLNLGCFARSESCSQISELIIVTRDKLAGINRNNDFQDFLAGFAVSSQTDHRRQKT